MADNNVFNLGADYLLNAQDALRALEENKRRLNDNRQNEKKIKRNIVTEEKSIQDEIALTVKKRKEELAASYDKQLDGVHAKVRETNAKRDRKKSKYVSQRVEEETAETKEANRQLNVEMKTLFKQKKVPAFCASPLYFSLYMPKRPTEFLVLLLVLVLAVVAVPALIFHFLQSKPLVLTITLTVVLFVEFMLYFIIFCMTMLKHRDTLLESGKIRNQVHANKKQMKAVKNSITKDKDESNYDLEKYDKRLQELDEEAKQIGDDKQAALTEFEQKSKNLVVEEIENRRGPKVDEMKEMLKQLTKESAELEKVVKQQSLDYTQNYEKYLGASLSKAEGLADLISIMAEGDTKTVGEAIAVYKGSSE